MRTLLVTLLLALVVPASALASRHDMGDGFLAVTSGKGMFVLSGRGSVLGHVDQGAVTITDLNPNDTSVPQVFGWETKTPQGPSTYVYSGTDIRFRFVGSRFRIAVVGAGVALSAVGQGRVTMRADDGRYALDGAALQPIPTPLFTGTFGLPPSLAGG